MKKILVANRGEIALRVMRSCREMGIRTVAVFSDADRSAPFVRYADEAVCIGPPPSNQSYLRGDKIIEVAKKLRADGIHPGYGFLSENAHFARKVRDAKLIFVGPTPEAMDLMGNKLSAKATAKKHSVPMVPGSDGAVADPKTAHAIAKKIGFPVLIKASAGGGGKGMRVVNNEQELEDKMKRAMSEAQSSFGDNSVFIEKYVGSPRHIEVQVLADTYGNIVYLFERECSIQRRHQKVIEEAPSSAITPESRVAMGKCAVNIARVSGYVNAGTVEFLLDENNNYYFLEMNTRLQVEHPVTECVTGIDLVKEQIRIARGERLSFSQEDLNINGHAIEIRVCAEDPANNFLPDMGTLQTYRPPQGAGIRVDDGFEEGMEIPVYYDPMIAKLIAWGKNRREAIDRMLRAIYDYRISGVQTTLAFCEFALKHEAFVSGSFDTHFVQKYFTPDVLKKQNEKELEIAALVAALHYEEKITGNDAAAMVLNGAGGSEWKRNRV